MLKLIFLPVLAISMTTCKLFDHTSSGSFTSLRRDDNGNVTVAVGIFMNNYPSVADGEFFPYELYDEEMAEREEVEFKGFAADVVTGKHPFEGFQNPEAVEKAKERSPQDPYYFDGYYLKIMVVNDTIAPLPHRVYLSRGFFPHNFYCPQGQESVQIKADDRALGDPQGVNVLGSPLWTERASRTVTFCKTKETNDAYAGHEFYYTRVSLFAEDTHHVSNLSEDPLQNTFDNLDSQYHETISALVEFNYKEGGETLTESATVVNLNYHVMPKVLEMHELLRQNSTADLAGIIDSTDKVQHYLHSNRNRKHNANWQVLLLAQRKWLAIRLILGDMGQQDNERAEKLRLGILTSLEVADIRDMLPLAEKVAHYQSAEDYLAVLRRNPVTTANNSALKELFYSATSNKHFNRLIYHIAISSTARQWFGSRNLYPWIDNMHDLSTACSQLCPPQERTQVLNVIAKTREQSDSITPVDIGDVQEAWRNYVATINKIYPDSTRATAAFKKKFVVAGNTIDFDNSSQEFKNAYNLYSRRFDLVFSEPHGLILGTDSFRHTMGDKRKPDNVYILKSPTGELTYDWKKHPPVYQDTIDAGLDEMLNSIYLQGEQLHQLAKKMHQHDSNAEQQLKVTSDFADHFQILPLAKALLIRPDYAPLMNDVFDKYTRFRPVGFFNKWVLGVGITLGAAIASLALAIPTLGTSLVAVIPLLSTPALSTILLATGTAAGLISSAAQYQHSRVVQQRAESSLFADNFGTNFEEYHRARQTYLSARRDLYLTAALTTVEAAAFVRLALHFGKATRQITSMKAFLGESAVGQYNDVFKQLKYCSSKYCRKFIESVPLLTANQNEMSDITSILDILKSNSNNLDSFKTAIKNLWMEKNSTGVFKKVIKAGFIDDVVRSKYLLFTDVRLPGVAKLSGITNARKTSLAKLMDKNAVEMMNDNEVLEVFGSLVYGRKYNKKFIFFPRRNSQDKLLAKKLNISTKELRDLYVGKYKGNAKWLPANYNEELKKMIDETKIGDRKTRKAAKERLQTWLNTRKQDIASGRISLEDADNFIALYENENRVNVLQSHFSKMLGKIAEFKKKPVVPSGDVAGEMVSAPGLVSHSMSHLLGLKKDAVEQVANRGTWQKIFAANPGLKEELIGEIVEVEGKFIRQGGELQDILENLNTIFHKAVLAYNGPGA